jgi:hypothetical protein
VWKADWAAFHWITEDTKAESANTPQLQNPTPFAHINPFGNHLLPWRPYTKPNPKSYHWLQDTKKPSPSLESENFSLSHKKILLNTGDINYIVSAEAISFCDK